MNGGVNILFFLSKSKHKREEGKKRSKFKGLQQKHSSSEGVEMSFQFVLI